MLVARLAGHTYVAVRAVAPGTVDRLMNPFLTALLILVTGVPFVAFLVLVPRRLLGLQIGLVRAVIAAIVGNVVWFAAGVSLQTGNEPITSALVTVQIGLAVVGAMAFLAAAEVVVPSGSGLRVVNLRRAWRRKLGRSRRYAEIFAITLRHGLLSSRRRRRASNDDAERRALARSLRLALEEGGVTFIKLGQLLSTRRDLLPPEYTDELGTLTDRAPPVAWEEVERTLHEEFGPAAAFAHVDPQPIAAASIAQVHAATLPSGEAVVVKVQRPNIGPLIARDVDILSRIARFLEARSRWARNLGAVELANGFATAIGEELDFRIEARNMVAVAQSSARRYDETAVAVRVPVPNACLCTRRVLVMERLEGTSIGTALLLDEHSVDQAPLARALLHFVLTQIMLDGVFHADPHPGNVLLLHDGRIGLLDFGSVGRLDPTMRSALRQLFVALDREDPAAARDALIEILVPSADVDVQPLERALGRFMAHHLGPSTGSDAELFADLFRLVPEHGLSVPPEVAAVFRCLATLEGTLTHLDPGFDIVEESRAYAVSLLRDQMGSMSARAATEELISLLPLLRPLPRRLARLTTALERGELTIRVRMLADADDRQFVRSMLQRAVTAFLGAATGIMAVLLLNANGGPDVTSAVSLFQLLGYNLLLVSVVLVLRALTMGFRDREN